MNAWIVAIILVVMMGGTASGASVEWVSPPTPLHGSTVDASNVTVQADITSPAALSEFLFRWDGTDYIFYDSSLVCALNLNNNTDIGETTTNAVDISGIGNGTLTEGAAWTADGKFGSAVHFDGSNDYISVPHSAGNDFTTALTVMCWINPADVSGGQDIVRKQNPFFIKLFDNQFQGAIRNATTLYYYAKANTGTDPIYADTWQHVAMTFDSEDGIRKVKLYLNGDEVSYSTQDTAPVGVLYSQNHYVAIGSGWASVNPYEGDIDEVRMYNRSLTSAEIKIQSMAEFKKHDATHYKFFNDLQDLTSDSYAFYITGDDGTPDTTTSRTVAVNSPGIATITYPPTLSLWQRDTPTHGEITVHGTYTEFPTQIRGRFDDGEWDVIETTPSGGTFTGTVTGAVGQGTLEVCCDYNTADSDTVSDIAVGDLFVIAGQSNFAMAGDDTQYLDAMNPYDATQYVTSWSSADAKKCCTPPMLNVLIQDQNVPISLIRTAVGASRISTWLKGQTNYDTMYDRVDGATNGTMKVRAMLWYQGESEARDEDGYTYYQTHLNSMVASFMADTDIADTVVVGQIGEVWWSGGTYRESMDAIREALMDSWTDNPSCSVGPTTYDIGPLMVDHIHFKNDNELQTFGKRFAAAVLSSIYGDGDGRGPRVTNVRMIQGVTEARIFEVTFDEPIAIADYMGVPAALAEGWRIVDGANAYTDANVTATEIVDGNTIRVTLDTDLTSAARLSLGSFNDGVGKNVTRGIGDPAMPAETIFNISMNYDGDPINYINPTPLNDSIWYSENVSINASIRSTGIDSLVYRWNGTDYTITDDCAIHYNFDNRSALSETATSIVDMSENTNDGTWYGTAGGRWTANGKYHGAYEFDGTNDYIRCSHDASHALADNFSISAWIHTQDNTLAAQGIASRMSGNNGWWVAVLTDDLKFVIYDSVNGHSSYTVHNCIDQDQWYHVVATFEKPTMRLFIDGEEVGAGFTRNFDCPIPNTVVQVSGWSSYATNRWDGWIDEFRLHDYVYTPNEVRQLYKSNLHRYDTTHWYFINNQTSLGADEYDHQLTANTLTSAYREFDIASTRVLPIGYSSANWWEIDRTFSQIDATVSNDMCYQWYNYTAGSPEGYYVGRSHNAATTVLADNSVFAYFTAPTTIDVVNRDSLVIPEDVWFYGCHIGPGQRSLGTIIASLDADGLDCEAIWAWDATTSRYTDDVDYIATPGEGLTMYCNNAGTWTI